MIKKIAILFIAISFYAVNTYCQNTNETPSLAPDTNKNQNNNLSIPSGGGGSFSPSLAPEKGIEGGASPLELEMKEELEESPIKSEPVPGAEILIEQEQNDIRNQSPQQPTEENKGKKKKEKPNK